jgi:cell wall-associated NlpC family hydrolase
VIKKAVALGTTVAAAAIVSAVLPTWQTASAAYTAPARLRVTADHAHSFRIAWDRLAGTSGYQVQVQNNSGAVVRSFITRRNRVAVRRLHAGQWYTVRVRAATSGSAVAWIRLRTSAPVHIRAESVGLRIAAYAKTFPGHASYVWGGTGPSGFDCSGLALYIYKHFGYQLPRTAQEQYQEVRHVDRSSAQPGDLVFFLSEGYAYHVGIYEGGNMMVAAATPESGVQYQQIYSPDVTFGTPA